MIQSGIGLSSVKLISWVNSSYLQSFLFSFANTEGASLCPFLSLLGCLSSWEERKRNEKCFNIHTCRGSLDSETRPQWQLPRAASLCFAWLRGTTDIIPHGKAWRTREWRPAWTWAGPKLHHWATRGEGLKTALTPGLAATRGCHRTALPFSSSAASTWTRNDACFSERDSRVARGQPLVRSAKEKLCLCASKRSLKIYSFS